MSNILVGGITTTAQADFTPSDLAPNNYLTIIWKNSKTNKIVNTLDTKTDEEVTFTTELNNAINQGIESGKVNYVGQSKYVNLESIAKYLSQNIISSGAKRQVVNALINIGLGSGDIVPDKIVNTCLNVFGNIAEKTAMQLNLSDPHELFSQVAGQNTITYLSTLASNTHEKLSDAIKKINNSTLTNVASKIGLITNNNGTTDSSSVKRYIGLVLGLTTSDTESYEVTIPKRKVEDGSDYATHLLPQNYKKDFTVKLTNKVLTQEYNYEEEINAIEFTKNKLIEIAQSHTLFDVYIRLSSNKIYKKENVSFTSLSFDKSEDSGNSYTCTFTIEPVNEFKTKIFVSNKKYSASTTKGKSSGSGTKSNRKQSTKSSGGDSFKVGYYSDKSITDFNVLKDVTWKNGFESLKSYAKSNNFAILQTNGSTKYLLIKNNNIVDASYGITSSGKYLTVPAVKTNTYTDTRLGGVSFKTGAVRSGKGVKVNNKYTYVVIYRNGKSI